MAWPLSSDYQESLQNPRVSFEDAELKQGQPAVNKLGLPVVMSGNFADVYQVRCPATGRDWAVKCFTREVPGLQDRYHAISAHLRQVQLPFTVDFTYLRDGIRIGRRWYPILKMQWVAGSTLNAFVRDNLGQPSTLMALSKLWVQLAQRLRAASIAHADLQHGNVLLVPHGDQGGVRLTLVDYDGMFVPMLAGRRSGEVGHPAYQHPLRVKYGIYNAEVDRFPHLVIACALAVLTRHGRTLWDRFDNGDNLLFRREDFEEPQSSVLLRELWGSNDALTHCLAGHLVLAADSPVGQEAWLPDLMGNGQLPQLPIGATQRVQAILNRRIAGSTSIIQSVQRRSATTAPSTEPWWLDELSRPTPTPATPPSRVSAPVPTLPPWVEETLKTPRGVSLRSPCNSQGPSVPAAASLRSAPDLTNSVGTHFKFIPAGTFMMGSTSGKSDERPARWCRISRPFYLGVYPVTQHQYELVLNTNPSHFRNPTAPVANASWNDAQAFCRALSALAGERAEGRVYRLPWEAEWEYAARAGSTDEWCFGNDESRLGEFAWYKRNAGGSTHTVGKKNPNAWGLYDMHGNVWEWCQDIYEGFYYAMAPTTDPFNNSRSPALWATGSSARRVNRGGAWSQSANDCRSARRRSNSEVGRSCLLGFRVALSL